MKYKYQNFLVALTIVAIVGLAFASTFYTSSVSMSHVSALYETAVVTQVCHADGTCETPVNQGHNLVVNSGLNWTLDKLFSQSGIANQWATEMAVANGTNAEIAALITLNTTANENAPITTCGLAPANVTGANLSTTAALTTNPRNYSLTYTWVSACTINVNNTGLYNSSTMSGFGTTTILFAGKNFGSGVALTAGDQLNVTWYVWATST